MAFTGRVVLFAEGSLQGIPTRGPDPFRRIWLELLPQWLGLLQPDRVIPISKKDIVAMDPEVPRSGGATPLDRLMARELNEPGFDVAVVAWDLIPIWHPEGERCRWEETVRLYRHLSESTVLPAAWVTAAARRYRELSTRAAPSGRYGVQPLRTGEVFAVCMEPTLESLLLSCEDAVRSALGVQSRRTKTWPRWDVPCSQPEYEVLQPAILAARSLKPRPPVFRAIRGDMYTAKNVWGEYLLRHMLDDPSCAQALRGHALATRLAELLHQDRAL